MFISRFRRIDTVTFPGLFLSDIELSAGDGPGADMSEVRDTILADRDSIDGIMVSGSDSTDILDIPDAFRAVKALRPGRMKVIIRTQGRNAAALDDLMGAGYADIVLFEFDRMPDPAQIGCIRAAREEGCGFSAVLTVSPEGLRKEDLGTVSKMLAGARSIMIRRGGGKNQYKMSEMASMAGSVKGAAKEVRLI